MTTVAGRRVIGRVSLRSAVRRDHADSLAAFHPSRWVLVSAASLPVVLVAAWLVADAVQPATYSPVRQTVSVLAGHAGTDRWIVTTALYVVGLAYIATAVGLTALPVVPRVALVIAGAAAIGVASFPQPAEGTSRSHAVCTGIGAVTIALWPALVARHEALLRAIGPRRSVLAMIGSALLFVWTAVETRNGGALGLAERASSAAQSCWPFVVVLALRRAHSEGQRTGPARAALNRQNDDQRPRGSHRGVDALCHAERPTAMRGCVEPCE